MRMGRTRGNGVGGGSVAQRGSELRPNNHLQQKTERPGQGDAERREGCVQ